MRHVQLLVIGIVTVGLWGCGEDVYFTSDQSDALCVRDARDDDNRIEVAVVVESCGGCNPTSSTQCEALPVGEDLSLTSRTRWVEDSGTQACPAMCYVRGCTLTVEAPDPTWQITLGERSVNSGMEELDDGWRCDSEISRPETYPSMMGAFE